MKIYPHCFDPTTYLKIQIRKFDKKGGGVLQEDTKLEQLLKNSFI